MKKLSELRIPALFVGATLAIAACASPPPPLATPMEDVQAPDTFQVEFQTGKGRFVVEAYRDWAPRGVDRFYTLVTNRFYDGNKFFRVLNGFVAQFGMHGNPTITAAWEPRTLMDDSVRQSNADGTVTFATGGPNTRTTQLFINTDNNSQLDAMGFAPIGRVVNGMDVVRQLYAGYGEGAPGGSGPNQSRIREQGNVYLNRFYPRLDSIQRARVLPR